MPRAEDNCRQDFLSKAYGIALNHEETLGYYNNDQTDPFQRIGIQSLENSFFSKAILLKMAKTERWKIIIYFVLWLVVILIRSNDLALIIVVTQLILVNNYSLVI